MNSSRYHNRGPPPGHHRDGYRAEPPRRRSPGRHSGPYDGPRNAYPPQHDTRRDRSPPRDDRYGAPPPQPSAGPSHAGAGASSSSRYTSDSGRRRGESSFDSRSDSRHSVAARDDRSRPPTGSAAAGAGASGFASPAGAAAAAKHFDRRLNFVDPGAYADLDPPEAVPLPVRDPPPPPREPGPGQAGSDYPRVPHSGFGRPPLPPPASSNQFRMGPSGRAPLPERPPLPTRERSPPPKRSHRTRSPSRSPPTSSPHSSRSRSPSPKRAKATSASGRRRSVTRSPRSPSSDSGRSVRAAQRNAYASRQKFVSRGRAGLDRRDHSDGEDDRRKRGRSVERDRHEPVEKRSKLAREPPPAPREQAGPPTHKAFRGVPTGPAADRWAPTGPKSHAARFAGNGPPTAASPSSNINANVRPPPTSARPPSQPSSQASSIPARSASSNVSSAIDAPALSAAPLAAPTGPRALGEPSPVNAAPTGPRALRDKPVSDIPTGPKAKLAPLKATPKQPPTGPRILAGNVRKFFPGDEDEAEETLQQQEAAKSKRGWKKVGEQAPVTKPASELEVSAPTTDRRDAVANKQSSDDHMDIERHDDSNVTQPPPPSSEQRNAWNRFDERRRNDERQDQRSNGGGHPRDSRDSDRNPRDRYDDRPSDHRRPDDFRRGPRDDRQSDGRGLDDRRYREERHRSPPRTRSPARNGRRPLSPRVESSSRFDREHRPDALPRDGHDKAAHSRDSRRSSPRGERNGRRTEDSPGPPRSDVGSRPPSPRSGTGSRSQAPSAAPSRPVSPREDEEAKIEVEAGPGAVEAAPLPSATELYERLVQVGEGTYGKVYKAKNTETGTLVALKRIRMEAEKDGFPVTAVREIKLLQSLRHPNVVNLIEMMVSKGHVYMVFEYLNHDLTGVLHHPTIEFTPAHLKSLMKQFLEGLGFIHRRGVLHRDLKGSNILIGRNGELKIADFGLARFYARGRKNDYTNRVITQWYKPPELLFGATVYGAEVDMWSAGCIFLELFARRPVFQGQDEIHQLAVIFEVTGTPRVETWPDLRDLPWYELVKPKEAIKSRLRETYSQWLTPAGLDVAERLLCLNPRGRPTAEQALKMPYFTQELPRAEMPDILQSVRGEWHEYESKRARKKAAAVP